MATFNTNTTTHAADVLSSSVAAAAAATFLVPSTTTVTSTPLHLETFGAIPGHYVNATATPLHQHHHHQTNSSTSSYTFVQIKREPCQVSEISSNNCHQQQHQQHQQQQQHHHHQQQQQHHHHHHHHHHQTASTSLTATGVGSVSSSSVSASKTMSSSTLTTLVKIEASSPKVSEMDKQQSTIGTLNVPTQPVASTSTFIHNSVPIGIAVARKRPQETTATTLNSSQTLPLQQTLNKDMNCFGIRVADMGGVGTGCGNIYFTGNGDLMTNSATAEELALSAAGVQSVNRAPSTFWQYPNALPIESVISMSPATVGLQYSREASRGQVVLLPAAPAALGISNFPFYTPTDPFQQAAAAAAFVWPSAYIPQATTAAGPAAAAAAAAALQPPPNFIFPSMGSHSALNAAPSYATSLQLYLAAAAGSSTLCQQQQQQLIQQQTANGSASSTTNSINLSLGSASSSSTSSRFLSLTAATATGNEYATLLPKQHQQHLPQKQLPTMPPLQLMPPTAMKIEEWNTTEFKHSAAAITTQLPPPQTTALNYDTRDKTTTTTTATSAMNLMEMPTPTATAAQHALNLMRLPTPPSSATMESAATAQQHQSHHHNHHLQQHQQQQHHQILYQANTSSTTHTPTLLNLSVNSNTTSIGPPTPAPCSDESAINFKTSPLTPPQYVVGIPRAPQSTTMVGPPPQMQDVNIQTDTPICSEDENSSCPLADASIMQQTPQSPLTPQTQENGEQFANDDDAQQPLELTKTHNDAAINECHNNKTAIASNINEQPELEQDDKKAAQQSNKLHLLHQQSRQEQLQQQTPDDLTGLELLSNISTITTPLVRVKQEPLEHTESLITPVMHHQTRSPLPVPPPLEMLAPAEPLGGLNLLCALAEQRIQEEVVQGGGLFASTTTPSPQPPPSPPSAPSTQLPTPHSFAFSSLTSTQAQNALNYHHHTQATSLISTQASFPSMDGLELPTTSSSNGGDAAIGVPVGESVSPVKRKKHKHSKSSSSASDSRKSCSKKNKKKRKHKQQQQQQQQQQQEQQQLPTAFSIEGAAGGGGGEDDIEEFDMNDEELQAELRSALTTVDPSFKRFGQWPNAQELFSIMETNMRLRLANITRQYRKKKRKLDEMSKHKKKKKCSKLIQQQPQNLLQQQQNHPTLSLGSTLGSLHHVGGGGSLGTSPLCDYKFPKFTTTIISNGSHNNTTCNNNTSANSTPSTYLQPSSFLRFQDKTHAFPPAAAAAPATTSDLDNTTTTTPSITSSFMRLEPSALDAATTHNNSNNNNNRGSLLANPTINIASAAPAVTPTSRLTHKHASTDKSSSQAIVCKERKLMTNTSTPTTTAEISRRISMAVPTAASAETSDISSPVSTAINNTPNPFDRDLQLTSEHLYRKETRVLTDMGGLFYAGIMKPLQPPDVYAITLDGERGNKSHIMSREEIFKDTILEVSPKSVQSVPVGTRLCAYWSQQYRCLYPGRAIESETSDDGGTPTTTPSKKDYVSVEFDDGDSGRIRLQNIRMLLSDYPIVEYNDNPLYSLGKQKKSTLKSSDIVGHQQRHQHEQNALSVDEHQQQLDTATIYSNNNNSTAMTATASELQTQRSEKKRLKKETKSLRKKSHAHVATNGDTAAAGVDINEYSRKHHKHKKRKKHKKHHRKAAFNDAEEPKYKTKNYISKLEVNEQDDDFDDNDEVNLGAAEDDDDEEIEEQLQQQKHITTQAEQQQHQLVNEELKTAQRASTLIKLENNSTTLATETANAVGIKVKMENLDMDDENTSNMMSEVSDEAKGDDMVGHNNSKGSSKIAAFLPERQLWGWYGTAYRKAGVKGRARKQFYKSIKRGKETITVGDCAVFLSTGRPDRPYIGRIESMWETSSSNKVVRVRWFYHPEETTGCPDLKYPGALFESPHEDENDVQTISHRCEVLQFLHYFDKFGDDSTQYQSIYDNNDTYYLAGYYNPRLQVLKLQDDIPTLEEKQLTTTADV